MKKKYIFVSSEDNKYLVKGGIGTYLGIFTKELAQNYSDISVTWIAQSPSSESFEEMSSGVHRVYLPSKNNLRSYAESVDAWVKKIVQRNIENGKRVVVESPEWEGLLSGFFSRYDHDNLLKVSRVHTPVAVTAALSQFAIGQSEIVQMKHEKIQMSASDLLSSPTKYIWDATVSEVYKGVEPEVENVVIPNCVNTRSFKPSVLKRDSAIDLFASTSSKKIEAQNHNIFIVGSVEKRKGSDLVVKMAEQVIKEIPHAHFYFIGHHHSDGGDRLTANKKLSVEALRGMASKEANSNIHFTGYFPYEKLPSVMPAGDLFVVSYLGDNFPGVVAEIGLSKRPLLALLRGGVNEMLHTSQGFAALTIDGYNEEEIIEQGVKGIIGNYRAPQIAKTHASNLFNKIVTEYNEGNVVHQLVNKYDQALLAKSAPTLSTQRLVHLKRKQYEQHSSL